MRCRGARRRWRTGSSVQPGALGDDGDLAEVCAPNRIAELSIEDSQGVGRVLCQDSGHGDTFTGRASLAGGGWLVVSVRPSVDLAETMRRFRRPIERYNDLCRQRAKYFRKLYTLFLTLIALFILFVATWIALVLARQISVPISALLEAAGQVRKGNLSHRVSEKGIDELASLIRAFNEMMQALEANSRELESRRQFTEAILESIPTGVISLTADGSIRRVNRALHGLFPEEKIEAARHLQDLFSPEDTTEIRYLMKRAQRTGAGGQPVRSGIAGAYPPSGRDRLRASGGAAERAGFRAGAGRHQRAAAGAEGRGVA